MRWIKRLVVFALSLYLMLTALVFVSQRKFLYFPPPVYLTPAGVELEGFEEVLVPTASGGPVIAWWSPPKTGRKTIMFFHGNGSAIFSNHHIYRELSAKGYGVLGVGYPGYPGSGGKPRQDAIIAAAQDQYAFLLEQGVSTDEIVFYGTSLGAGVAAQLARSEKPVLLIAEAPFNSVLDMSRMRMPFLPVKLLLKDRFRSDIALSELDMPLIWIHGTSDRVIPIAQGQKLYDGYNGPKAAHIIPGGIHNNLWGIGGRDIIFSALAEMRSAGSNEIDASQENNSKLTPVPH